MWRLLAVTLGSWAAGAFALRAVVVPAEICPPITPEGAVESAQAAAAWIERVQRPDGTYLYEYDIDADEAVPGYNVVRHAGVTMSLYQLAAAGHPEALAPADRGLAWMQANLMEHDDWSAILDPDTGMVRLGANALLLAGLAHRRLATDDTSHDGLMRDVARFLVVQQQEDGSLLDRWDTATRLPDPSVRSKYATGEAFWALALLHRLFPDEGWDAPAHRVAGYLACCRDTVEGLDFPPWADQWAAYGLAELGPFGLTDDEVAYARRLSERFGFLVRAESQRRDSWFSKLWHGRQARAAGMGTWVEALDSLWTLATVDPRMADLRDKLAERAVCGAGMLRDRQVTGAEAQAYGSPGIAEGAWFTEGRTRMDDQQHALSGLILARPILAERAETAQ